MTETKEMVKYRVCWAHANRDFEVSVPTDAIRPVVSYTSTGSFIVSWLELTDEGKANDS